MAKIKANKLADVAHTTSAVLTFPDDAGQSQKDTFTIIYRGMSAKTMRDLAESRIGENRVEKAKYLATVVKQMPEVIGDDEQPVEITFEFFDSMEIDNLSAIFDAVQEGYNPNPSPSEASLAS